MKSGLYLKQRDCLIRNKGFVTAETIRMKQHYLMTGCWKADLKAYEIMNSWVVWREYRVS